MENHYSEYLRSLPALTLSSLQHLKEKGFQYVQVRGMTRDHRPDYMEPHYLMLVPIKDLPRDQSQKDVYADIDSKIILEWASHSGAGIKVIIAPH
ncbi:MAG TPA: hypothetical protein VKR32_17325 [Puia sp.]|nr:hypothetical protein [Puia sp.]